MTALLLAVACLSFGFTIGAIWQGLKLLDALVSEPYALPFNVEDFRHPQRSNAS